MIEQLLMRRTAEIRSLIARCERSKDVETRLAADAMRTTLALLERKLAEATENDLVPGSAPAP